MIPVSIKLEGADELVARFEKLPTEIEDSVYAKMEWLAEVLYKGVLANLSGKILQTKTGQLRGSIRKSVKRIGPEIQVEVGPEPVTAKSAALEYGGKRRYPINAVNKDFLRFIGKHGDIVFRRSVSHPPSKEFRYLRSALEEMPGLVQQAMLEALNKATRGTP